MPEGRWVLNWYIKNDWYIYKKNAAYYIQTPNHVIKNANIVTNLHWSKNKEEQQHCDQIFTCLLFCIHFT
jgi:hypothetical protein